MCSGCHRLLGHYMQSLLRAIHIALVPAAMSTPRTSALFPSFFEALPSMEGKTVVITGASRGLGYVTALSLAKKGATIILLNRKTALAEEARAKIAAAATAGPPALVCCDLLSFESVRAAAREVISLAPEGIDCLCCNAGVMMQADEASEDGYDITIATNCLSHFLLARSLLPALEMAAARHGEARLVTMSSGSGFGAPALDVAFFARNGGRLGGPRASYERYHQSKLANLAFTAALDERLRRRQSAVKALACTPGVCATDMYVHVQSVMRPGQQVDLGAVQSVEDGSLAQLKCIADPAVASGECWGPAGWSGAPERIEMAPPRVLVDTESKARLWAACEAAVGAWDL